MTAREQISNRAKRHIKHAPSFPLSAVPAVRLAQLRALVTKQVLTKQQAAKLLGAIEPREK